MALIIGSRTLSKILHETGAERFRQALTDAEVGLLDRLFSVHDVRGPGQRLYGDALLSKLLLPCCTIHQLAQAELGDAAMPRRALLFDKQVGSNWALGWHQDRTIAVLSKSDVIGFGPWTKKAGVDHVEQPFEIIEKMVTLRVHLDPCDDDNAPLKIAPGSHRLGRVPARDIGKTVRQLGSVKCLAKPGDVWLYATPILHASDAAHRPTKRRVLQIDFSAAELPGGLQWYGV